MKDGEYSLVDYTIIGGGKKKKKKKKKRRGEKSILGASLDFKPIAEEVKVEEPKK